MSGVTIAKTFAKIVKDYDYINRIPEDKVKKILNYNLDDVVNLFYIYVRWKKIEKYILDIKEDLQDDL